jgi:hypothetical protein
MWLCIALAAYAAIMPFYRATLFLEIKYNEGWNAYNAAAIANHAAIYPVRAGWKTANYPVLSFFVVGQLGRITHDYLFTGRFLSLLSLLLSCAFAGAIVYRFTASRRHGVLTGFFCLALFCANAHSYVGMNDPQMFAQSFFMAGLLAYVVYRDKPWALVMVALLFATGGNIKHNLIDFPLAVALELWLVSRRRLALFAGVLALLAPLSFYLNVHLGGAHFFDQMLTPRGFHWDSLFGGVFGYYIVLLIPFAAAIVSAVWTYRDAERRVIAIFFAVSFAVGSFFAGGDGVSINAFFSNTFAVAILLGLFMHRASLPQTKLPGATALWSAAVPLVLFFWLLIPLQCDDILFPLRNWKRLQASQQRFAEQVNFLRAQPGAALCESMLRCYYAGKPYILDPFNSTSLIQFGLLDENVLVDGIRNQQFSAIQFNNPPLPDGLPDVLPERFTPAVLRAVRDNYTPMQQHPDCTVYVPIPRNGGT